jgi:hypothetical protein
VAVADGRRGIACARGCKARIERTTFLRLALSRRLSIAGYFEPVSFGKRDGIISSISTIVTIGDVASLETQEFEAGDFTWPRRRRNSCIKQVRRFWDITGESQQKNPVFFIRSAAVRSTFLGNMPVSIVEVGKNFHTMGTVEADRGSLDRRPGTKPKLQFWHITRGRSIVWPKV